MYGKGRSAIGLDFTLKQDVFDVRRFLRANAADKDMGTVVVLDVKAANATDKEPPSISWRCKSCDGQSGKEKLL